MKKLIIAAGMVLAMTANANAWSLMDHVSGNWELYQRGEISWSDFVADIKADARDANNEIDRTIEENPNSTLATARVLDRHLKIGIASAIRLAPSVINSRVTRAEAAANAGNLNLD